MRLGALLFLQLLLGELADRGLGQLRPDLERDRHLVLADLAVEMLQQLLEGERGAGLQLDEDLGRLLAMRMGDADDDAFVDRGMLVHGRRPCQLLLGWRNRTFSVSSGVFQ